MRLKKRKLFRKKESVVLVPFIENKHVAWSKKLVSCKYIGDFGYHWLFINEYGVFHLPTGIKIAIFDNEKDAKVLVKRLYYGIKTKWSMNKKELRKFEIFYTSVNEILYLHRNSYENKKINPEEDIPF